ncbi:MAG: precorrin-6y C5,15-methyltransferase (decarboxylating) subunit CbiE [Rhizonema sp. PD38]|nr:precorrin-6y C5,15-methyltransferase (decarboxylating) subunit CbiE [Rhizonema sp. PD38]
MQKWLSVVGIGEDGLLGLSPVARSVVEQAQVLVGGDRHLAMLTEADSREKLVWSSPITTTVEEITRRRGQAICVLASGDPMCFGIGVTLCRRIPISEMTIIPAASAFSLACSRLGWSGTEVETLSLVSRPPSLLQTMIYPRARLLILSEGRLTPDIVAQMLVQRGFGRSQMTVLERMGGPNERIVQGVATSWQADVADLNTIAVECIADTSIVPLPRIPGLPDSAYHHDGQLTKREVRAMTLAALVPTPFALLWDVGAGCGSIGIEWMRSHPLCRAIAIEQNPLRLRYIADNAAALGTPNLHIFEGKAPIALSGLESPNAIFIGGGATAEGLFETCWQALQEGGRLVANAVTIESEQKLLQWRDRVGGTLTRIAIQRAEPVGTFSGWRALAPVTQWVAIKLS